MTLEQSLTRLEECLAQYGETIDTTSEVEIRIRAEVRPTGKITRRYRHEDWDGEATVAYPEASPQMERLVSVFLWSDDGSDERWTRLSSKSTLRESIEEASALLDHPEKSPVWHNLKTRGPHHDDDELYTRLLRKSMRDDWDDC